MNPTQPNPTQPNPTQPNPTQPNPTQPNPTQPNPTMKGILSVREFEVLELIAHGRNAREIAFVLGIEECTVRFHVENILYKRGAKNRTEAAHVAFKEGWLAEDEI